MYGGPIRPDIHSHLTNIFTRATLAVCVSVASQSSIETSEFYRAGFWHRDFDLSYVLMNMR